MFQALEHKFQAVFRTIAGRGKLSEKNIDDAVREIKMALLAADVNAFVVKEFIAEVRALALGKRVAESLTPAQQFIKIVHEELVRLMGEPARLDLARRPPVVICCVGLQGSGKTTTIAKLARFLTSEGKRCYLVPADLRRPAAIEQLTILGKEIGVEVHPSQSGGDSISVVEEAVAMASRLGFDVVIVDTSGRLHIDDVLMAELTGIVDRVSPHQMLFIADAMTGQDAVRSAKTFAEKLPLTGIVLTKLDGDAAGGAALSIRRVTGLPILFVGMGEKVDDLERFLPERMASRILGMGDLLSVIEEVGKGVDETDVARWEKKALAGEMTLDDLKRQFVSMRKMGSMERVLGMLPGMAKLKDRLENEDLGRELRAKEAIIDSMTTKERRTPKILNGSRRKRIALGSGTNVSDVNRLIKEFEGMRLMMKRMTIGGMKNMMRRMTWR